MKTNIKPKKDPRQGLQRPKDTPVLTPLPEVPGRHPNDGWPLARPYPMGRRTLRALTGLIGALVPTAPAPHWDGMWTTLAQRTRVLMAYMHPLTALAFSWMILVLDWAPIWRLSSRRRLHRMPREEAARFLERLSHSRFALLRQMVLGIRAAVLSAYYDATPVHEALDYYPEAFVAERVALRRRLKAGGAILPQDHLVTPTQAPA